MWGVPLSSSIRSWLGPVAFGCCKYVVVVDARTSQNLQTLDGHSSNITKVRDFVFGFVPLFFNNFIHLACLLLFFTLPFHPLSLPSPLSPFPPVITHHSITNGMHYSLMSPSLPPLLLPPLSLGTLVQTASSQYISYSIYTETGFS